MCAKKEINHLTLSVYNLHMDVLVARIWKRSPSIVG